MRGWRLRYEVTSFEIEPHSNTVMPAKAGIPLLVLHAR
jgi:hypothetical protein